MNCIYNPNQQFIFIINYSLQNDCIFVAVKCTRSLMDKMLDSGSDDGGSSPFGCTNQLFFGFKVIIVRL